MLMSCYREVSAVGSMNELILTSGDRWRHRQEEQGVDRRPLGRKFVIARLGFSRHQTSEIITSVN